jgi:glucosamine-6-phosphate deaminase
MSDKLGFQEYYHYDDEELQSRSPVPLTIVESDIDLYYHMALDLHDFIARRNEEGKSATAILPVGPVFQYRRFRDLVARNPIDLSGLKCFFMDEYLAPDGSLIAREHPLSFRGFIEREFAGPLRAQGMLRENQVHFPDPQDPERYDEEIASVGGVGLCHAGVGINGHLAFNEAAKNEIGDPSMSVEDFANLPSRLIELSAETRITNSHTALSGAFEHIPYRAVTVGMRSILGAERVRVYLNRPWQRSVLRKALFEPPTSAFPVTILQNHPHVVFTATEEVRKTPRFVLA